jgi:MFS family permease
MLMHSGVMMRTSFSKSSPRRLFRIETSSPIPGDYNPTPALPETQPFLIKADLDLSNTQLGLAFSAFAYAYALFQLIGGYFGDKFGARLTLFVSGLIVCAATAATGAVGGLASLFAARLFLGIGEGHDLPTSG